MSRTPSIGPGPIKKINPNTARPEDLLKVKGMGKRTVDAILAMRDKGVVFNDAAEFTAAIPLQGAFRDGILEALDFAPGGGLAGAIDPDRPIRPMLPQPQPLPQPLPTPPGGFRLRLTAPDTQADFAGMQVAVSYTEPMLPPIRPVTAGKGARHQRILRDLSPDGTAEVLIAALSRAAAYGMQVHIQVLDRDGDVVLAHRTKVSQGETVTLALPRREASVRLALTVAKQAGVDYQGYRMVWRVQKRVRDTVTFLSGEINLVTDNTVTAEVQTPAVPVAVEATVRDGNGQVVLTLEREIGALKSVNQVLQFPVTLPAPQQLVAKVQLDEDIGTIDNPYADHRLVVAYDVLDPISLNRRWSGDQDFAIDADGTVQVALHAYGEIANTRLSVKSPSGDVLSTRSATPDEFGPGKVIRLNVPPRALISDPAGFRRLPARPQKALCRLLDPSGQRVYSDVQVIFYLAATPDPLPEDFAPALVGRSEANGYFSLDIPREPVTGAFARVGVAQGARDYVDVPIRLDMAPVQTIVDEEIVTTEAGFLPGKIILVVDTDAPLEDEDCCDDCSGLKPMSARTVLEEFSFHSVVRTSEPDIQGFTLGEDAEMSVADVLDVLPIMSLHGDDTALPPSYLGATIRKDVLLSHTSRRKGLNLSTLTKAIERSNALRLRDMLRGRRDLRAKGRAVLSLDTAIDWDDDPTIYQATSLAHGHILHFKQEWISEGYSLGDILYSLPLAPGQKKQIVVLDWEHRNAASRTEQLDLSEALSNELSRDRDINEIVAGTVGEQTRGGSRADTSSTSYAVGAGFLYSGFGIAGGVAGGKGSASSSAWQNSARNTSLSSAQALQDRTTQSAAAVRSQRATVIETSTQGERFSAQTESVANYNHCHSLTIQYFEVLRHFRIEQRLAAVQECLFIPLMMSPFTFEKILRWREFLQAGLRRRALMRGFAAIERIENDYEGSDLPEARFADEGIDYLDGEFTLEFRMGLPTTLAAADDLDKMRLALEPMAWIIPGIMARLEEMLNANAEERHRLFLRYVAPELAIAVVQNLKFIAVIDNGGIESEVELPLDATLVSRFVAERPLQVSVRQTGDVPPTAIRAHVKRILITKASSVTLSDGSNLLDHLPETANILIRTGTLRYRTANLSATLFSSSRINDDLLGYSGGLTIDFVALSTPLNRQEMRNPRNEDLEMANALQDHLNDNLEYYHQVIWARMSPERRFMFLDGVQVTDWSEAEYPGGVVRSVASVVENKVIGVVGNSLVMPVAAGFRLDPYVRGREIDLLSLYKPPAPFDPIRLSLPSKGVFAEAVMGRCNACEKIDDTRFWRWSEEPIPDSPTQILPVSTAERGDAPKNLTPAPMTAPIINLQNAPAAPDPTGLGAAAGLLSNPNLFRDATGLAQNQQNAMAAMQTSMAAAQAAMSQGAQLAALGAKLDAIKKAAIPPDQKEAFTKQAIAQDLNTPAALPQTGAAADSGPISRSSMDGFLGTAGRADTARVVTERNPATGVERTEISYERGAGGDRTAGDAAEAASAGDRGILPSGVSRDEMERAEAAVEAIKQEAPPFDGTAPLPFGTDTLAADRPPLALLTGFVSQYGGDPIVPQHAVDTFAGGAMLGLAQTVKYDQIASAIAGTPRPRSWLLDRAMATAGSRFSAYVAVHNHLRAISGRPAGFGYEAMILPWDRDSAKTTTDTAVYLSRKFLTADRTSFEDHTISLPRGPLSAEAFFKGATPSAENASGFYVMNAYDDAPFTALAAASYGRDTNDRYHHVLAMAVVEAIMSDSVNPTFGLADVTEVLRNLMSLSAEAIVQEAKGLAYCMGVHAVATWFRDRLIADLQNGRTDNRPEVLAWYYMNALSFFEGDVYGGKDIARESRIHLDGAREALSHHPGARVDDLWWAVPLGDTLAKTKMTAITAFVSVVAQKAQEVASGNVMALPSLAAMIVDGVSTQIEMLDEAVWPYCDEILDSNMAVVLPYAYQPGGNVDLAVSGTITPISAGSPAHAGLVPVAGPGISAQNARVTPALGAAIATLALHYTLNYPDEKVIVLTAWVDPDAAGAETLDPAFWAGEAVHLTVTAPDDRKLGRLAALAGHLPVDQVDFGDVTLPDGRSSRAVRLMQFSAPVFDIDMAVAANDTHARTLGWDTALDSIMAFFGITDSDPARLVEQVADFQRDQGFDGARVNGQLDPTTWPLLRSEMGRLPASPQQPGAAILPVPVYHVTDALAYLRAATNPATILTASNGTRRVVPLDTLVQIAEEKQVDIGDGPEPLVRVTRHHDGAALGWTRKSNLRFFYRHNLDPQMTIAPATLLPVAGLSGTRLRMATEYNASGGLMRALVRAAVGSALEDRAVRLLLALIGKEGQRFVTGDSQTPPRPVTRFENHVAYKIWISQPETLGVIDTAEADRRRSVFDRFFKPRTGTANHKICTSGTCSAAEWKTLHSGTVFGPAFADLQHQAMALFAQMTDEETSHRAASYGGPQILGDGHRLYCGYPTAKALYAAFFDQANQITAMVDFMNTKSRGGKTLFQWVADPGFGSDMVWGMIAGAYNGDGTPPNVIQESPPYSKGLKSNYDAALTLIP